MNGTTTTTTVTTTTTTTANVVGYEELRVNVIPAGRYQYSAQTETAHAVKLINPAGADLRTVLRNVENYLHGIRKHGKSNRSQLAMAEDLRRRR
jgi:hypothetical protein